MIITESISKDYFLLSNHFCKKTNANLYNINIINILLKRST